MTRIQQPGLLISFYIIVTFAGCYSKNFIPYKSKGFHAIERNQSSYIDSETKNGFMTKNNFLFLTKRDRNSLYNLPMYKILAELKQYLLPIYAGTKRSAENLPEYDFVFKCFNIDSVNKKLSQDFQSIQKYLFNTERDFYTTDSKKAFFYYKRNQNQIYTFITTHDKITHDDFLIVYSGEFKDVSKFLNYMERWDLEKADSNFRYTAAISKYGIDTVLQIHALNSIYNIAKTITSEIEFLQLNFYSKADSLLRDTSGVNYLKPVIYLLSHREEVEKNELNYLKRNEYYQCLATYYSFLGSHKNALTEESNLKVINQKLELTGSYQVLDAKEEVFKNVAGKKIIAFNEAHHDVRNRFFVLSLLDSLKKLGFTHLAIEDFNKNIRTKGVNSQSGFYLNEPLFYNLITYSQKLGLKLISYDYKKLKNSNADTRDRIASHTLLKQFNLNKNDRLIIYCGYGHIDKFTSSKKDGSLIQNIWHSTGIEPYTINLAFPRLYSVTDSSIRKYYAIKYDTADFYAPKFINGDLKVFPPNVVPYFDYDQYYKDGLTQFIQVKYRFYPIDTFLKNAEFSFLVYQHKDKHDFELEVPVFTKELKNETMSFNYYVLERGLYDIYIRTLHGNTINHEIINI